MPGHLAHAAIDLASHGDDQPAPESTADPATGPSGFVAEFATTPAQIQETQRLRYDVFAHEMGARIDGGPTQLDEDRFDQYCDHLAVRDAATGELVASTRILPQDQAERAGGFYSDSEFVFTGLDQLPGPLAELGRTCVAPGHRHGGVITALWQAVAQYVFAREVSYLFGCASVPLRPDEAAAREAIGHILARYPSDQLVARPRRPLPGPFPAARRAKLPPVIKAALALGSRACGPAHWDQDFRCADVLLLLDVNTLNARYARRFLTPTL